MRKTFLIKVEAVEVYMHYLNCHLFDNSAKFLQNSMKFLGCLVYLFILEHFRKFWDRAMNV